MVELFLIPFALLVLLGWMIARKRWDLMLFATIYLTVYEGVLRKWLLPAFQMQIYFIKDGLVILTFAAFLSIGKYSGCHERDIGPLRLLLLLTLFMALLQLANPYSPSIVVGIFGVKNYLLYTLLLFMVPYAFNSVADFERKLKIFMILMIPVSVLGLIQYLLPPDHMLNTYVGSGEQYIARFGEGNRVRTTGTFSYLGGFSTFVGAMFVLALAFALASGRAVGRNIVPFLLLAVSCAALFTTGSRTVVWGAAGQASIVFFLCMRAGLMSSKMMVRLIFGGAIVAVTFSIVGGGGVESFNERAFGADSNMKRFLSPFSELVHAFQVSPLIGMGIGSTHGATTTIMNSPVQWWLKDNYFEVETATVMQEVGPIGFVLVYFTRIYLLYFAVSMVGKLRTPLFKGLSAAIASFFCLHLFMYVINNPTAGVFYWFAVGLLLAMYRLDFDPLYTPPRIG